MSAPTTPRPRAHVRENTPLRAFLILLGVLTLTPAARADIADSPLPVLAAGQKTLLLYSVPGVINDGGTNLATYFSCTPTSTSTQQIGIELSYANGTQYNVASPTALAAGATTTINTRTFADAALGNPNMPKGSARILSTSKSLICTAFVTDTLSTTPAAGWELTIVAQTKQKAAN